MRAAEALSIRYRDIDWENHTVMLRAEFTKTREQRFVFLTKECINQLQSWKEHRERERRIVSQGGKKIEKISRPFKENDLFFTTGHHVGVVSPRNLYHTLVAPFDKVLDSNGFEELEENNKAKRHKITLHSFRRFVKTTISKCGHQEYSEWFIGHAGSTYFTEHESEALETFHKVEPYLTFLDYSALDAKGVDVETKLNEKDQEMKVLKDQLKTQQEQLEVIVKYLNKGREEIPTEIIAHWSEVGVNRPRMPMREYQKERVELDRKYGRDTTWYKPEATAEREA
jgi:hypothetical protein